MKRRILLSILAAFALFGLSTPAGHSQESKAKDEINVLFIGNSLTYYNDLPKMVVALAKADKQDRKSTRLNSSHIQKSRMPSSA